MGFQAENKKERKFKGLEESSCMAGEILGESMDLEQNQQEENGGDEV